MLGSRPLTIKELQILDMCFMWEHARVAFKICLYSGLRPQEVLSLRVGDVVGVDRLLLSKRNSKGKLKSRSIKLHPDLISVLSHHSKGRPLDEALFLDKWDKPLKYHAWWRQFKTAVERANLKGKVGLHSGRKTFAQHIYRSSDKDVVMVAHMLGHRNLRSTLDYLSFETVEGDRIVEQMPWAK